MSREFVTNSVTQNLRCLFRALGVSNSLSSKNTKFNSLKRRALQVFVSHDRWLDPPTWARLAGFYPIRAAYTYLRRLHRYGLLNRGSDGRGRLLYRISLRGQQRLNWLRQEVGAIWDG